MINIVQEKMLLIRQGCETTVESGRQKIFDLFDRLWLLNGFSIRLSLPTLEKTNLFKANMRSQIAFLVYISLSYRINNYVYIRQS